MTNTAADIVSWKPENTVLQSTCPVCNAAGEMEHILEMACPFPNTPPLQLVRCNSCESGFVPDYPDADYGSYAITADHIRFYVEQGAAVDLLARPGFLAGELGAKNYLEIGGGYGFGVDFAEKAMGLNSRGIDPAPQAKIGSRDLDISVSEEYLTSESAEVYGKQDAIVAMEVIEHIPEPKSFLKIIRDNLTDKGIVMMSTPNIDALDDRNTAMLLPILSPGYHAILFSNKALKQIFYDAGFKYVDVTSSHNSHFITASVDGRKIDSSKFVDNEVFTQYTSRRMKEVADDNRLWCGFAYRDFKASVNHGDYEAAAAKLEVLFEEYKRRFDCDLSEPFFVAARYELECDHERNFLNQSSWARALPFHVCNLFYFAGVLKLNTIGADQAIDYFNAGAHMARRKMEHYSVLEYGDGETAELRNSSLHLLAFCAQRMSGIPPIVDPAAKEADKPDAEQS